MLLDSCHLCSRLVWNEEVFCKSCFQELSQREPLYRTQGELEIYSLCFYKTEFKKFILKGKQGAQPKLIRELSRALCLATESVLKEKINGVIPIPSHTEKVFDHAGLIAHTVSEFWGTSFEPSHLAIKSGEQKNKAVMERLKTRINLKSPLDKERRGVWILADDVITTGATLLGAHKALGKPSAIGLTLATRPYVLIG